MKYIAPFLILLAACSPPQAEQQGASQATQETTQQTTQETTQDGRAVRLELEGDPALGPATVVVYILDGTEGVSGAQVEVTADMTHAGMIPVIADAPEASEGLYRTQDFEFNMAGDWIVTADVTLPDGENVVQELEVTVPGR